MHFLSKSILAVCSLMIFGSAYASERHIVCGVGLNGPNVNSLWRLEFKNDNLLIQRRPKARNETEYHHFSIQESGTSETFSWKEINEVSRSEDRVVSDEVTLVKSTAAGGAPQWLLRKDRLISDGREGCIKNEDYGCKDTNEVLQAIPVDCRDDLAPESNETSQSTWDAIASDPCNPDNWGH